MSNSKKGLQNQNNITLTVDNYLTFRLFQIKRYTIIEKLKDLGDIPKPFLQ